MEARSWVNKQFGSWTVLSEPRTAKEGTKADCVCSCGRVCSIFTSTLKSGRSTRCVSCKKEKERSPWLDSKISATVPVRVMDGSVFSKWTVLSAYFGVNKNGARVALCRCACGTEKLVKHCDFRSGRATQCVACAQKERGIKARIHHRRVDTPEEKKIRNERRRIRYYADPEYRLKVIEESSQNNKEKRFGAADDYFG